MLNISTDKVCTENPLVGERILRKSSNKTKISAIVALTLLIALAIPTINA